MTALALKLLPPPEAKGELAASYGRRGFQFHIPVRETARPFVTLRLPFSRQPERRRLCRRRRNVLELPEELPSPEPARPGHHPQLFPDLH